MSQQRPDEATGELRLPLADAASPTQNIEPRGASELSIISQPIVIHQQQQVNGDHHHHHHHHHHQQQHQQQVNSDDSHLHQELRAPASAAPPNGAHQRVNNHWILISAAQTSQEVRRGVSLATDQLGYSLRQLYASASSIAADVPPAYHNIPGIVPYYHGRSSGPPPSYDDVMNPYAPPPTYQSLFGQMLEARKSSRGLVDLLRRLLILSTLGCSLLIACMILIPFTMIIVGAIYLGDCRVEHLPAFLLVGGLVWASKNMLHCWTQCKQPPEPQLDLNVYLSSSAEATPASTNNNTDTTSSSSSSSPHLSSPEANLSLEANQQQQQQQQHQQQQQVHRSRIRSSICESLLNCLLFAWFIVGCVLVFRNYEPDFVDPLSPRYCNRTVYLYTFWLISSAIIMLGLFVSCVCCLMVSSAVASQQDEDLA